MNGIALLIQLALISQLRAEDAVNPEEEEAMNQLMDTLMDDEKNDELVDMIAASLVTKMLGFNMATLPQAPMMAPQSPAMMRSQLSAPQQFAPMTAPDLQVNVDNREFGAGVDASKFKPQSSARTERNWGTKYRIPKGGDSGPVSEYLKLGITYPDVEEAKQDGVLVPGGSGSSSDGPYKATSTATTNQYGVSNPKLRQTLKIPVAGKTAKGKEEVLRSKEFDVSENKGKDPTPDRYKRPIGMSEGATPQGFTVPSNLDEYDEEPDAITVLAVGIASAFVGSAATFVLFHLHRSLTKSGNTMRAPLLTGA